MARTALGCHPGEGLELQLKSGPVVDDVGWTKRLLVPGPRQAACRPLANALARRFLDFVTKKRTSSANKKDSIAMTHSPTMTAQTELATTHRTDAADPAWIRPWLRAEGLALFAAGLAGFLFLGLPWWAFLLFLIIPDVSMVGYLRGPRVGAIAYNVAHDLVTGAAIAGLGLAIGSVPVAAIGAILVAHSGMDRMMGYGLKLPSSFKDTHLGRIGRGR